MWIVYILKCSDGSYYTGCTNNLEKRVEDHLSGKGGRYTRSHSPQRLVYQEVQPDRSSAQKREAEIKKLSRDKKELIIHGK